MEPFNFDKLPEVVRQLFEKVESLEILLQKFQPQNEAEHEFLNIKEAAEYLKITVPALYTKVSRKEIPVNKPGKRLYFKRSDLQEWIKLGRRKTASELIEVRKTQHRKFGEAQNHKLDKY